MYSSAITVRVITDIIADKRIIAFFIVV